MEPIETGESMKDYLRAHINPVLVKGLTELCHEKPQDPLVSITVYKYINIILSLHQEWLAYWILNNNPNKPQIELT